FQAEDGIRDRNVTGVQTCALPISEHMKKQGFELKRGERGSDRKHIETAKFKKQTLEKEIDFLEKNLAVKKDEWTAYSDKVKSDLEVPAKRHMKSVEVPTGEKS